AEGIARWPAHAVEQAQRHRDGERPKREPESARERPRRRIPLHPRGGDAGHAAEQPCRERDQLTELVPEMVRERQKAGDEREHGEERQVQPRADSCSQPVAAVRWIYDVASGGPASEPARALAAA